MAERLRIVNDAVAVLDSPLRLHLLVLDKKKIELEAKDETPEA